MSETPVEAGGTEQVLRDLIDLVEHARSLPMSTSIRLERDDVLELLDEAIVRLPDELRAARYLLKERDEFLARTRREADEILAEAKSRVAHLVQRSEVVKAADHHARQVLDEAEDDARRMKHEAEDYCDQKLASFQVVLERIGRAVAQGRQRLAATVEEIELAPSELDDDLDTSGQPRR